MKTLEHLENEPTQPDLNTDDSFRLINGFKTRDPALAQIVNDPIAVLALKLVADQKSKVESIAARRSELINEIQELHPEPSGSPQGGLSNLDRLEGIQKRKKEIAEESAALSRRREEANANLVSLGRNLEDLKAAHEKLSAQRRQYATLLWWLFIGWLIWKLTGGEEKLLSAARACQQCKENINSSAVLSESLARQLNTLNQEKSVLSAIEELDRQPLSLLKRFGWSHIPLHVEKSDKNESSKLVFTNLWAPNFNYSIPDIPGGLVRVAELRRQIIIGSNPPLLLSPTTTLEPEYLGLKGEELILAQNIEAFAKIVNSDNEIQINTTQLPGEPLTDDQLQWWLTTETLERSRMNLLNDRGFGNWSTLLKMLWQVKNEKNDREQDIVEHLKGLASGLKDIANSFEKWRNQSIDQMLSEQLKEWSQWSMLPLIRRYCPSYHHVPAYRYHRLGFKPEEIFQRDKRNLVNRLPDPGPIQRKLKNYDRREESGDEDKATLVTLRKEIINLIRQQVEGSEIESLSPAAKLEFKLDAKPEDSYWHCGLCSCEPRIGGPGKPEEHIGCPEGGRFTLEEAEMGEQYVQYEDLLIPMLTALWNEKTTYDELNRIVREKEKELRENLLQEEEALRKEALYFKEAARDRLLVVEEVHGQADRVFERFREEVANATRLGAIDEGRQRELVEEVKTYQHLLSQIPLVKATAVEEEEYLADEIAQATNLRQVALQEIMRRGSDAPSFIATQPEKIDLLFMPQRSHRIELKRSPETQDQTAKTLILIKKTGDEKSLYPRDLEYLSKWMSNQSNHHLIDQYEAFNSDTRSWIPLRSHPKLASIAQVPAPQPATVEPEPIGDDTNQQARGTEEDSSITEPPPLTLD